MFLLEIAKIKNTEDKIPDITNLAANALFTAKVDEVKGETSSITNLLFLMEPNIFL